MIFMTIKERCRVRLDLTDYLTHFIHKPLRQDGAMPLCYDKDDKPIVAQENPLFESQYQMSQPSSFEVLQKILHDGIIRSGWSRRGNSPTIYGKRSAVCFTEMPLYALAKYAIVRDDAYKVDQYGIALNRYQLFQFGARPVIYGISDHSSGGVNEIVTQAGYRLLDESIHVSLREQYRFVRTELSETYPYGFDWMHEREWRWPLPVDENEEPKYPDVPGIPIYSFKDCCVLVKTRDEQQCVIKLLRSFIDDPNWRFKDSKGNLTLWKIIAFDDIKENGYMSSYKSLRIEDLDHNQYGRLW